MTDRIVEGPNGRKYITHEPAPTIYAKGATLRDTFAIAALPSLMAGKDLFAAAKAAYAMADAMLEARAK